MTVEHNNSSSVGLYIHVPFCQARCHFCAFYLEIHREQRVRLYLDALAREVRLHAERDSLGGRRLETVYFGGGTPTTLQADQLSDSLTLVRESLGVVDEAEITVEAHPDNVTEAGLRTLFEAGFNRISFGAQSMDAGERQRVGRHGSNDAIETAVRLARHAGFTNINLDLIYGLPSQTLASWAASLQAAMALEPTHLSCYALTLEGNTKLHAEFRRGDFEPDQALHHHMEEETSRRLETAGFEHYEISNYCRPGHRCRHNLQYWTGQDYLGLGPSAQSYLEGSRFGAVEDLDVYIRSLAEGRLPVSQPEALSPAQRRREAVVFGLRLLAGVDHAMTQDEALDRDWQQALDRLMQQGLVETQASRLRLTETGRRFADSVAVELL